MLDGIADHVRECLADAGSVPLSLKLASRFEIHDALRMQRRYFFDRLSADLRDIHIGTDDRDATAQSASREIQEIADQRIHALTTVQNKGSALEKPFRKLFGIHHDVRRPDDGAERGTEIVTQHGEKHLLRLIEIPA